jgi:hypothetical protein
MAFTPSQRMGPPPGASPPMRIAASWSRPTRGLPNTSVLGCSPMARSPRIVNPARTHPSLPLTSPTMRLDNSCPIQACPGAGRGPRLGLQFPGFTGAAVWADEALGPARREQVSHAGRLIREALLELDQGTGKIGHLGRRRSLCSLFVLTRLRGLGPFFVFGPLNINGLG